jgi:hypothetical protein
MTKPSSSALCRGIRLRPRVVEERRSGPSCSPTPEARASSSPRLRSPCYGQRRPGIVQDLWSTRFTVRLGTPAAENDLRGWLNNGLMTSFFLVGLKRGTSSTPASGVSDADSCFRWWPRCPGWPTRCCSTLRSTPAMAPHKGRASPQVPPAARGCGPAGSALCAHQPEVPRVARRTGRRRCVTPLTQLRDSVSHRRLSAAEAFRVTESPGEPACCG